MRISTPVNWTARSDFRALAAGSDAPAAPAGLATAEAASAAQMLSGTTRRFCTHSTSLFPLLSDLEVAARHDFTILLIGETGTGKTYLAKLIHELSSRRNSPFLTVACGALPNDLIESELFGHVRGAFTGAERQKQGKFEAAAGGTILLDEVDLLGIAQQAKLLRVLETGEFEAVGSNDTLQTSARTIVASNRPLEALVAAGHFRNDLLFRLKQVKFEIPPLRLRPMDIEHLAQTMIDECCQNQLSIAGIDPEFWTVLRHYSWPGNLRELKNEVRRAVLFARGGMLTPDLLSSCVVQEAQERRNGAASGGVGVGLAGQVALTEQETIEQMLRSQKFNRAATARALGISRVTLYNKIRKYHIRLDGDRDTVF